MLNMCMKWRIRAGENVLYNSFAKEEGRYINFYIFALPLD